MTFMLIDDDKIDLFIHKEIIKRLPRNCNVVQFTFGGDALQYLSQSEAAAWPDVILLDIHMPVMNGFDFLDKYTQLAESCRRKCRVMIVSSSLDTNDINMAKTNPAVFAQLEKPLKTEDLIKILQPTN